MTIKIGTIGDLRGEGEEILVDAETQTFVLARFYNGSLMSVTSSEGGNVDEPTVGVC